MINVTTPGVTSPTRDFDGPLGTPINLLSDPDQNFKLDVQLHAVNPEGNKAIETVKINVGGKTVQFANDGSLLVDGQARGNIKSAGFVDGISLGNGITIKSASAIDGANGQTAERFVLVTPEYEVTAALRQPSGAKSYYDVNIAERTAGSADNASGDNLAGQGNIGIDDLLRLEPS
jgi:hypothetical protein